MKVLRHVVFCSALILSCEDGYGDGNGDGDSIIDINDYSIACQSPQDCKPISTGEQCSSCKPCANAAINISDYSQYLEDVEAILCEEQEPGACIPCLEPAVACVSQTCELTIDVDQTPTATINETEIYSLTGINNEVMTVDGSIVVTLLATDVGLCDAIDDETRLQVRFTIENPADVPLNQPIDLTDNDLPFSVEIAVGCFCAPKAGEPQYSLSGQVQFRELSANGVAGDLLSVVVNGDIPLIGGDIYREDSVLEIDWIDFRAPVTVTPCSP